MTEDRNALGLGILHIFSTWEIKTKEEGYKVTREDGKILKAYSGLTNDIHNLSIIIDMMIQIINKSKVDKELKSKDFLYISVLLESYFTNLRSIFDFTTILNATRARHHALTYLFIVEISMIMANANLLIIKIALTYLGVET